MTFQIHGLQMTEFAPLFELTDDQLASQRARRVTVDAYPGAPCRVSLADANVGETVILTNYEHHAQDTPYQASHAIYVRESAVDAHLAPGEVPKVLTSRLLSVRGFSESGDMTDADVVDGQSLEPVIQAMFRDDAIAYLHVHFAKRGCFAAKVTRAFD